MAANADMAPTVCQHCSENPRVFLFSLHNGPGGVTTIIIPISHARTQYRIANRPQVTRVAGGRVGMLTQAVWPRVPAQSHGTARSLTGQEDARPSPRHAWRVDTLPLSPAYLRAGAGTGLGGTCRTHSRSLWHLEKQWGENKQTATLHISHMLYPALLRYRPNLLPVNDRSAPWPERHLMKGHSKPQLKRLSEQLLFWMTREYLLFSNVTSKSRQKERDIYTLLRSDEDDNDELEKRLFPSPG